jgi:hypothetical protein
LQRRPGPPNVARTTPSPSESASVDLDNEWDGAAIAGMRTSPDPIPAIDGAQPPGPSAAGRGLDLIMAGSFLSRRLQLTVSGRQFSVANGCSLGKFRVGGPIKSSFRAFPFKVRRIPKFRDPPLGKSPARTGGGRDAASDT